MQKKRVRSRKVVGSFVAATLAGVSITTVLPVRTIQASTAESVQVKTQAVLNNQVTPAPTSILLDQTLSQAGIDLANINENSVLKLASLFHIFANEASLSADTNGNLAVKTLNQSNDFGTRGSSFNLTSGDIHYIQNLNQPLISNAFRNSVFNHVVFGESVDVTINGNKVLVNGVEMTNLTPSDVYQDTSGQNYIDFASVFAALQQNSATYTTTADSSGVTTNFTDMNQRSIDVSNATPTNGIIYVSVPFEYLQASQPITIKGLSSAANGPVVVVNVKDVPSGTQSIATQVQLNYTDGTTSLPNSESHSQRNVLVWNFGNGSQTFDFNSGRFMGSILAPNATINANVNIDGNIVANVVNIKGGESHRWDVQPPQPTDPQPTEPQPTEPQPTDPQPTEPQPTDPQPTEPQPTDPQPTEPQPTDPQPTDPQPTEPQPTDPQPTEPQPTEPQPTEAQPTEAQPTEAQPTEAQPTKAKKSVLYHYRIKNVSRPISTDTDGQGTTSQLKSTILPQTDENAPKTIAVAGGLMALIGLVLGWFGFKKRKN